MADWISLTLADGGWPDTSTNRVALEQWALSEGMPVSANNPLAASDQITGWRPTPGYSEPTYPSVEDAAALYARKFQTLTYDAIGFALNAGDDLNEIFTAINESPWCSGCQGGNYPIGIYQQLHGGAGGPPVQQARNVAAAVNLPSNTMTRAWAQLMRTLAVDAPRQLREAKTARARIRKAVR